MRPRMARYLIPLIALFGIAFLGATPQAHATLTVTLSQGANTLVLDDTATPGVVTFSGDFGTYTSTSTTPGIVLTVTSNSPGQVNPEGGTLRDFSLTARNTTGTPAGVGDALTITAVSDGYDTPAGSPLLLTNSLAVSDYHAGSGAAASAQSISFVSDLDGQPTPSVTLSGTGQVDSSATVDRMGATYTLTNVVTVKLARGGNVTFDATTRALAVVPEPASVTMAVTALPMLSLGLWLRRRRAQA